MWALNILALLDSLYLVQHHYKIHILKPSIKSFCSMGRYIDCDLVAASSYAFVWGIPSATWGIFGYTFTAILLGLLLWGRLEKKKGVLSFLYLILWVMLSFSLYKFFISAMVLHSLCLMCCFLYLCVITMAILLHKTLGLSLKLLLKELKDYILYAYSRPTQWLFLAFIILVSAGFSYGVDLATQNYFLKQQREQRPTSEARRLENERMITDQYNRLPIESINLKGAPSQGDEKAELVLVEFSDFECHYCRERGEELVQLVKNYPGKIRLYYKYFPLDHRCNPIVDRPFHQRACLTARYAYCAQKQNVFWPMHDKVFANQAKLSEELLKDIVQSLNLDDKKWQKCLESESGPGIGRDIQEGIKLGVQYTPTIYMNGRKVSDIIRQDNDLEFLIKLIMK